MALTSPVVTDPVVLASTAARMGQCREHLHLEIHHTKHDFSHNKADCPNPRVMRCNHCGDEGHMVRDCPTAPAREFTGECRICNQAGHMAKDCPDRGPEQCKNCQQEGRIQTDLGPLLLYPTDTLLQQDIRSLNARMHA
ncbi:hypothetical protein GGR56DRAFT_572197 [Xylariaceae sp. FL0804]|nr:hypothetical protein GGR56DRAFT_572197 [Xylariaceae sp. FL0804]